MGDRVEAEHRGDRAGPCGPEGQAQAPANLRSLRTAPLARRQGGPGTGRHPSAGIPGEPSSHQVDEARSGISGAESGMSRYIFSSLVKSVEKKLALTPALSPRRGRNAVRRGNSAASWG